MDEPAKNGRVSVVPTVVWVLSVGAIALGTSEEMALVCSPLLIMLFPVIILIQHFHLTHRHVRWWTALTVNGVVLVCYLWFVYVGFVSVSSGFFADTDLPPAP